MDLKGYLVRSVQWTQGDKEAVCEIALEHATDTLSDGTLKTKRVTMKVE